MFYGCPSGLRKTSFGQPSFREGKLKMKDNKSVATLVWWSPVTHPVTPDDGLISYLRLKIRDEKSGDHEDM